MSIEQRIAEQHVVLKALEEDVGKMLQVLEQMATSQTQLAANVLRFADSMTTLTDQQARLTTALERLIDFWGGNNDTVN
jgi:ATP-dependent Clp protease ATP-binding subunit ClpA